MKNIITVVLEIKGDKKELNLELNENSLYDHVIEISKQKQQNVQVWIKGYENKDPILNITYSSLLDMAI